MTDDFDPMAPELDAGENGSGFDDAPDLDEGGLFLLAFTFLHEMRVSKNDNEFARVKGIVLHGVGADSGSDKAGHVLWESLFLNPKARKRLAAYCRAMGATGAFRLDKAGLTSNMLGRPFLARVKVETNGKYTDARVKWPLDAGEWTKGHELAAAKFLEGWQANAESSGGSSGSSAGYDEGAPMPSGDDIPF